MNAAGDLPADLLESHRAWIAAVNETDLAGYADLVCEEVVWLPPGAEALRGRAAFRGWLAPFFEAFAYRFSLEDVRIRTVDGWALEKGTFRTVMTDRSTGEAAEHSGHFIALWRQEDDRWRIDRCVDDTGPSTSLSTETGRG